MKISKRERKLIIVGVAVAFAISFKFGASALMVKGQELKKSVEVKGILLERYRLAAAEKSEAVSQLELLTDELKDAEGGLLGGGSPTLASVELQRIMEEAAKKRGVAVKRVKTLKPKEDKDYHKVFVEISFSSGINSLVDFLYDIESNPKAIIITELNTKRHIRKGREPLQTTLKVEGKFKKSGKDGVGVSNSG